MLYDVPSPTHGYMPVVLVFWLYVGVTLAITLAITFALGAVGVPFNMGVLVFVGVGILLLPVFLPKFRQRLPGRVEAE
ncbi:hypothetical protein ACFQH3_03385 [Haladaptatus sp. GCM10025707]|uniref:hypothetical protein n=1 Tax=unclassified Haladaptatus TaxID=2622732 RepID=UPI0023E8CA2B|nr:MULTISPECIES: hypothetical protein [unclassified Haladaptatus]